MVTKAEEYMVKAAKEREVTLPSGAVFKVKNISGRDFIREGGISLDTIAQLTDKTASEKKDILAKNMLPAERKKLFEYNDMLICKAVIDPRITLTGEGGSLSITDIVDEDYYFLLKEVIEQKGGGDALAPFRKGDDAADTGRAGGEIREAAN